MKLTSLATDNITEVLVKVIQFTRARQKLLARNINNVRTGGFVPRDLPVAEFCAVLHHALEQHIANRWLVLCDTKYIKFGFAGKLDLKPVIDVLAEKLLRDDPDCYLEFELNKLFENTLNQRIAAELLKQKRNTISIFE